jgi:hypothetical protein
MLKNAILYGLLGFLMLAGACNRSGPDLKGCWFYTYSSDALPGRDTLQSPASFLNLQSGGIYTRYTGIFEYGTWDYKEKVIRLTSRQAKVTRLSVLYEAGNQLQLGGQDKTVDNYERQPGMAEDPLRNPFSMENNLWRIPPQIRESQDAINSRLINHCRFWEKYFRWALESGITSVDVRATPSPLKIYGNGFTLKPFDKLPPEWKSFFFDSLECQAANDRLKTIMEQKTLSFPPTQNKYTMFISVFQQMQHFLR